MRACVRACDRHLQRTQAKGNREKAKGSKSDKGKDAKSTKGKNSKSDKGKDSKSDKEKAKLSKDATRQKTVAAATITNRGAPHPMPLTITALPTPTLPQEGSFLRSMNEVDGVLMAIHERRKRR